MSKKILAILLAATMLLAAGCSEEPSVSYIDGCVAELGQYKDRAVTVTEAEIKERMLKTYREYATYSVLEDGVIAEDSAIFLNCSANSGDAAIDSLSFEEKAYYLGYEENLPGFDDAIVGKNIGDTVVFTLIPLRRFSRCVRALTSERGASSVTLMMDSPAR